MSEIGYCQFCGATWPVGFYQFSCLNCDVKYTVTKAGQYEYIIYYLKHPIYYSVAMDMRTNTTIVWYQPDNPQHDRVRLEIPQVFPQTKPNEALLLAQRLHKLVAFS